jgi:hypothetical protein
MDDITKHQIEWPQREMHPADEQALKKLLSDDTMSFLAIVGAAGLAIIATCTVAAWVFL